jgi:hypothetical protein
MHVTCSCMVGNIAKGVFDSLIGNLDEGYNFGKTVGLRMMIAMVGAIRCVVDFSGCAWCRRLGMLLSHLLFRS